MTVKSRHVNTLLPFPSVLDYPETLTKRCSSCKTYRRLWMWSPSSFLEFEILVTVSSFRTLFRLSNRWKSVENEETITNISNSFRCWQRNIQKFTLPAFFRYKINLPARTIIANKTVYGRLKQSYKNVLARQVVCEVQQHVRFFFIFSHFGWMLN